MSDQGHGGGQPGGGDPNSGWSQPDQPPQGPPQQGPPPQVPPQQGPPPQDPPPQDPPPQDPPQYGQPGGDPTQQFPPGGPQGQPGDTQQYPPPPDQPQYGQQQYGQPQYGQQQYGQQQYGQEYGPQYGQPGYGDPAYGAAGQYGPPGQYGQPGYPAPPTGGGRNKALLWGILAAVVVAGLAIGAFFLFSGDDNNGGSPSDPVRALFNAGKANDLTAAKKTLCQANIAAGVADDLDSGGRVTAYSIGKTTKTDSSHATVQATVTSSSGKTDTAPIPVIKENGDWKVCFPTGSTSSGSAAAPSIAAPSAVVPAPSISIPSVTIPSISVPSISVPSVPSTFNICSGATTAAQAARVYISAAELGQTDLAQACVYQNKVSRTVTDGIHTSGEFYTINGSQNGPTFEFKSVTTSKTIRVTIVKESDGKYWVTGVTKS